MLGYSVMGKLKINCPSLYYSLSAWEHDSLDSSITLEEGNTQVFSNGNISDREGFITLAGNLPNLGRGGTTHYTFYVYYLVLLLL